ncbi:hypothetical protein [Haladaptatus pallidirubidus]
MELEQRYPVLLTERYGSDAEEEPESVSLVGYLSTRRAESSSD